MSSDRELRVKLPSFLVLALRETARRESTTVSAVLQDWLLDRLTIAEVNDLAATSQEFKAAAESWLNARR